MPADRIWIEAWNPEYGASYEVATGAAPSEEEVATPVEVPPDEWAPLAPAERPLPPLAFLDGVSRVDARAFLDSGPMTTPGICGSVGIGAVFNDRPAAFGPWRVRRAVIFGAGEGGTFPPIDPALDYAARSVPGTRPEELRLGLEGLRASAETEMARELASAGRMVVADGPLGILEPIEVVGFIKSHQKAYLPADLEPVVRALGVGQRTPLFSFGVIRPRYSWYLRLADASGHHPWAAVARCEVSATLSLEAAAEIADITAFHLPRYASKPFWDARAPQNLVPIATLERRLWHLLGDRGLVYRKIRSALMNPEAA
jgi:hypothetical protein